MPGALSDGSLKIRLLLQILSVTSVLRYFPNFGYYAIPVLSERCILAGRILK